LKYQTECGILYHVKIGIAKEWVKKTHSFIFQKKN